MFGDSQRASAVTAWPAAPPCRARLVLVFFELRKKSDIISDSNLRALSNGDIFRVIAALLPGKRRL